MTTETTFNNVWDAIADTHAEAANMVARAEPMWRSSTKISGRKLKRRKNAESPDPELTTYCAGAFHAFR